MSLDADLDAMDRDRLVDEMKRLRAAIREHRESTVMDLCRHHPQLGALLPDSNPAIAVPQWPQFLRGCVRYCQSLEEQAPLAPRTTEKYDQ